MDNDNLGKKHEGLPVSGYKPQNQTAIDLVNANKAAEERLLRTLDDMKKQPDDRRSLARDCTHVDRAGLHGAEPLGFQTRPGVSAGRHRRGLTMADDRVKLRPSRWGALVIHAKAFALQHGGEYRENEEPVSVTIEKPQEVDDILYLPATYVLDERDTRA